MARKNVKKSTEMMVQNSPRYKHKTTFALVFITLLLLSIFSVYAQENGGSTSDSSSETAASSDSGEASPSIDTSDSSDTSSGSGQASPSIDTSDSPKPSTSSDATPSFDSATTGESDATDDEPIDSTSDVPADENEVHDSSDSSNPAKYTDTDSHQGDNVDESAEDLYLDLDEIVSEESFEQSDVPPHSSTDEKLSGDAGSETTTQTDTSTEQSEEEIYVDLEEVETVVPATNPDEIPVESEEVYVPIEDVVAPHEEDESDNTESTTQDLSESQEHSADVEERYLLRYTKGNTVIKTSAPKNLDVSKVIQYEESVSQRESVVEKSVRVFSEDHYTNELTVYTDISETREETISLYWREQDRYLEFDAIDRDGNGLIERIAWVVPHLSSQHFDITVDFGTVETGSDSIDIHTISAPTGSIESAISLDFIFGINYTSPENVSCQFELRNESQNVVQFQENGPSDTWNLSIESLSNGAYLWDMDCIDESLNLTSNTLAGSFVVNIYYAPPTPQIDFTSTSVEIDEGGTITFGIDAINATTSPRFYTVTFGDGSSPHTSGDISTEEFSHTVSHSYSNHGTFTARLTGSLGTAPLDESIEITVNEVVSTSSTDTDDTDPVVTLLIPDQDQIFTLTDFNDEITFQYNASDDVAIDNCTLHIYYYNTSQIGTLVFTDYDSSISNGQIIDLDLKEFDSGEYTWDVECYDNSSNFDDASRDFTVQYEGEIAAAQSQALSTESNNDFERSEEIEEYIRIINEFLVEEERYNIDQKEAVIDLEIIDRMKFYKKKLLQMRTDLSHNLEYIRGATTREERKEEIYSELDDIGENLVVSLDVIDTHEYTKNSIDVDFEDIVSAYASAKNLQLTNRNLKDMAKNTQELQNKVTVSASTKHVRIEYLDRTEEKTVVTKDIQIKDVEFTSILESIPTGFTSEDIDLLQNHLMLRDDPLFEIKLNDLEDDRFVYVFDEFIELTKLEETTTIGFLESIPRENLGAISGFATFVGGNEGNRSIFFYISWLFVFIFVLTSIFIGAQRMRMRAWMRNDSFRQMKTLVIDTRKAIKNNEISVAREKYNEAEALYPLLPPKCKRFAFEKISQLSVGIDKKDITSMVKEFITASKEGRNDDALLLYERIQSLYPKMPPKFKQKVYEKMNPHIRKIMS